MNGASNGIVWDIITFFGLATFAAGLAFVYWPTAMLFVGLTCIAVGVVGAKASSAKKMAQGVNPAPLRGNVGNVGESGLPSGRPDGND